MKLKPVLFLLPLAMLSCIDQLMPDREISSAEIFEIFAEDLSRNNPFICDMELDFDSLRTEYKQAVSEVNSSESLFNLMWSFMGHLKDGHARILGFELSENGTYELLQSDYPNRGLSGEFYLSDFRNLFLEEGSIIKYPFVYGRILRNLNLPEQPDITLGYLHISRFRSQEDDWERKLDEALEYIKNCEYLFLDLRNNCGGESVLRNILISKFIEESRLYGFEKVRKGTDDWCAFSVLKPLYMHPAGKTVSKKTIYIGIDRKTNSAGSWAALQFSLMDNTILIGDTTYGAWGRLVEKQLPNGWTYGYSIARCYSPDMVFLEGRGVPPDIRTSSTHIEDNRDPVLEAVIKDITSR